MMVIEAPHAALARVLTKEYIGLLSESVVSGLEGASPPIQAIWDSILKRAYDLERVTILDKEILSRIKGFSVFDGDFPEQLQRIFMSPCEIVDIFLKLATAVGPAYYSREEFSELVSLFLSFQKVRDKGTLPTSVDDVPYFDEGGKEWLDRAIA